MTRGLRAKSIEKRRAIYREHFDEAVELAVGLYRSKLQKPCGRKRLGLAKIASNVRAEYVLIGHPVKLSPQTILNSCHVACGPDGCGQWCGSGQFDGGRGRSRQ
jgi:tRNA(Ile)-lysidine synthase TilS/MesJ